MYFNTRRFFQFFCLGILGSLLFATAGVAAEALSTDRISMDRVFPDSTKGFISTRSVSLLTEKWKETQIGTLMNDPIMQPFKDDFNNQLAKRMEDRFGLTLDGVVQAPEGAGAAGMIAIPGKTPGYVLVVDVSGRTENVRDKLENLSKKFLERGVKRTTEKYKGSEISVLTFPKRSETAKPAAEAAPLRPAPLKPVKEPVATEETQRNAYYLVKNDYLVIADQLHLAQLMADRTDDSSKNALADVENYQIVMKRCIDDLPEGTEPLIRWYIDPLNYGESIRVLMQGPVAQKRKNKPSIFSVLKEQGFDAIQGIGGIVNIRTEDKEVVYRFFIHTKKPYRLAMRMFVFPDSTNFVPPTWMPTDLARCSMFYVDPVAIFDNFGTLFDALIMQGGTGVWKDILDGLETDPHGPQINIREEIVVHLGHRVLGMSRYELPISPQSESIIVCVELKEGKEEAMNKALQKLFDNDTEMQKTKHKSYILWHRVAAEDVIMPGADLEGVPSLVSTPSGGAAKAGDDEEDEETEKDAEPFFPDAAITVAKGCLFVGTNSEYLKTILDRLDEKLPSIGDEAEYKEIDRIFASMGLTDKAHFMQFFVRTDATLQPTYELIRQGRMGQSQAVLGKALNAILMTEEEKEAGVRKQAIDGGKLPEFEKVRKYFGPSGLFGATEEDGYFFKGFLLEKEDEEQYGPNRNAEAEDAKEKAPAANGTVLLNGKPLEGAKVEFRSADGAVVGEAEVKKNGKFEIETETGKHEVVLKVEPKKDSADSKPIRGKVSFSDGTPLTGGIICFASETAQFRGEVRKDGTYALGTLKDEALPNGTYQVYFVMPEEESESFIAVHEKYTDPKTSGLLIKIDETVKVFDIKVESE